jgi:uncharacterized membrane protein YfcA
MDIYTFLGYTGALVIGLFLGLIGGGGSILSVPILAYLFSYDEKVATAYSLFIVGVSALAGGLKQNKKNLVDWRIAFIFGLPALLGVSLVRHFLIPIIPEDIFTVSNFTLSRRMLLFGLFSALMIPAAISMLRDSKVKNNEGNKTSFNYTLIIIEGVIVGSITGLVGAGGGFLIIPALVLLAKMEIKLAIGTSLIIIAFKSLLGFFLGDAMIMSIDWMFLFRFTLLSLVGIFIGTYLCQFIDARKLKKGFAFFIFIMSGFIFYMEFFIK